MFVGSWQRSPWRGDLFLIAGRIAMPYGDTPGADGLGDGLGDPDAHPDYDPDLDAGDGLDDDPSGRQPAAPAGRQPAQAPARPGAQPGAPGQDGGTPQTYTTEQYNQVVTGYRTLEANNQQLQGQLQLLQRQVAALTGQTPPAGPGAGGDQPQLTEADQKAIKAVYRLFPQLKPLLEKAQDLLALPETVTGFQNEAKGRWDAIGTQMWDALDVAVKATYGETQLHPFAQKSIDSAFVAWLETDANAAARYRMGDTRLGAEFMRMYRNGVIVPAQQARTQPPGAPRRPGQQQPPARVPRGGAGGTAVGQRPGQPNVKKPDELHEAAADAYFTARG